MGILHMFLGWFFHLKAIKKSKHFYWAPHNTQSVSSLTSCLPCPLGPQVQVAAGRTWMERDGGWARDLMRPMLEKKRKGMAGPRKSLTLGEAVFLHSVTITPNIPQGNCPQPLTCHLPGKIWAHPPMSPTTMPSSNSEASPESDGPAVWICVREPGSISVRCREVKLLIQVPTTQQEAKQRFEPRHAWLKAHTWRITNEKKARRTVFSWTLSPLSRINYTGGCLNMKGN